MESLGSYHGHPIVGASIAIRNTGHGLEKAMSIEPQRLPMFQKVYVVLECDVDKHEMVQFEEGSRDLVLVNKLKAGRATIVAGEVVEKYLDDQQRRIDEAAEQQALALAEETEEPSNVVDLHG